MISDARPAIFRSSPGIKPLYRLPDGRWAMMDLQGAWFGRMLGEAAAEIMLEADGQPCKGPGWECEEHCVMTSHLPNPSSAWSAWSAQPPSLCCSEFPKRSFSVEGVGWLLAENCSVSLNKLGPCIHVPQHWSPLPLPFWDGFQSDCPLAWMPLPWRLERLFDSSHTETRGSRLSFERASAPESLAVNDAEGTPKGEAFRSVLGRAFFSIDLPAEADYLIMRRTYDAFHGMQRARIFVGGDMAGWWHQPEEDREKRWAQDDLILPVAQGIRGQRVEVSLEPPAGSPLFSIARIECWATIPQRLSTTSRIE